MQESIEESLDLIDETYQVISEIHDIPVFYAPRLSHPDPSVERRSGFLTPSFQDTRNLGEGLTIPYFWAIDKDKDLTITNKLYV